MIISNFLCWILAAIVLARMPAILGPIDVMIAKQLQKPVVESVSNFVTFWLPRVLVVPPALRMTVPGGWTCRTIELVKCFYFERYLILVMMFKKYAIEAIKLFRL